MSVCVCLQTDCIMPPLSVVTTILKLVHTFSFLYRDLTVNSQRSKLAWKGKIFSSACIMCGCPVNINLHKKKYTFLRQTWAPQKYGIAMFVCSLPNEQVVGYRQRSARDVFDIFATHANPRSEHRFPAPSFRRALTASVDCYTEIKSASLSGTFLQTLPYLVTPLKGYSLSPLGCPPTRSASSESFGY